MDIISEKLLADIMSVSSTTITKWKRDKKISPIPSDSSGGGSEYLLKDLAHLPQIKAMLESPKSFQEDETPLRDYTSIELFAGAGGLAIKQYGSVAIIIKSTDLLVFRHNYPAKAINCL
ncbi:hypothetical protein BJAS_P4679 [Bathymodiolus japonicus methanotrophic gill symbiont]|nr:hypothetical protein BJAS_P4679 [Bathymodiolus japonicus methanotrophic gill symbiont]